MLFSSPWMLSLILLCFFFFPDVLVMIDTCSETLLVLFTFPILLFLVSSLFSRFPFPSRCPGYGLTLVAESTTGCLLSAEQCAEKGSVPEELGLQTANLLCDEIAMVRNGRRETDNGSQERVELGSRAEAGRLRLRLLFLSFLSYLS